jgi:hypothetical protein
MDSSEADDENKNDGKTLLYVFERGYIHRRLSFYMNLFL